MNCPQKKWVAVRIQGLAIYIAYPEYHGCEEPPGHKALVQKRPDMIGKATEVLGT